MLTAAEHALPFKKAARILTLGVGQEAVERRDVAWARGDSDGVVLRDAVSLGNTCTPREMMESGICAGTKASHRELGDGGRTSTRTQGDAKHHGTMKTALKRSKCDWIVR